MTVDQNEVVDPIRIATPQDYQELFRISCLLHRENGMHPFSEEKAKRFIWRGCNQDQSIIGVIGPSHDIKAMIYLELQHIYYSDDWQIGEAFSYVRPDCRRSDFAKRLIRFAKKCSDKTGLDLCIGVMSDHRLAAKGRLYEREFNGNRGVFFIHSPKKEISNTRSIDGNSQLRSVDGYISLEGDKKLEVTGG